MQHAHRIPIFFYFSFIFSLNVYSQSWHNTMYWSADSVYSNVFRRGGYTRAYFEFSCLSQMDSTRYYFNMYDTELGKPLPTAFSAEKLRQADALKFILERARNERVIMINEAHHEPQHRLFTADVLIALNKQGFNILTVEVLWYPYEITLDDICWDVWSGTSYLREPQYFNLIRTALSLGMKVYGHESEGGLTRDERERRQAEILQQILENNPDSKMIVHAGWGHIREDTMVIKTMGYYFRQLTGIDPFTISQCSFGEQFSKEYESIVYDTLAPKKKPCIYTLKNGNHPIYDVVDVVVFHPRTKETKGRPSYLAENKRYKKLKWQFNDYQGESFLAFVLPEGQNESSCIPIDIITSEDIDSKNNGFFFVPFSGKFSVYVFSKGQTKYVGGKKV